MQTQTLNFFCPWATELYAVLSMSLGSSPGAIQTLMKMIYLINSGITFDQVSLCTSSERIFILLVGLTLFMQSKWILLFALILQSLSQFDFWQVSKGSKTCILGMHFGLAL